MEEPSACFCTSDCMIYSHCPVDHKAWILSKTNRSVVDKRVCFSDCTFVNNRTFMAFMCRSIDSASELKFWPGVVFSDRLEKYIVELADVHSVHPDSFALMLINFVAATLEFSYALRANISTNTIPTNLYNILVARSCKITMKLKPGVASRLFQLTGNLTWHNYFETCRKQSWSIVRRNLYPYCLHCPMSSLPLPAKNTSVRPVDVH